MSSDRSEWECLGIPVHISDQVEPGDIVAFSMIYEPTEDQPNRWRIEAVKVTSVASSRNQPTEDR